jgi:STE24 endopeptidase
MTSFAVATLILLVGRGLMQLWLNQLNRREVLLHRERIPAAYEGVIDPATYDRSVAYTLAKNRLSRLEILYDVSLLAVVLFSGVLPASYHWWTAQVGNSPWALAGWLWIAGACLALASLPLDWYAQFHLEEKFGFNTSTPKLWVADRIKGLALALGLGLPLLWLLLKIIHATVLWWLWGWAAVMGFQLLMLVLAPVLIMPLFNKFSPLPPGSLRDRLLELARRTGFQTRGIQVMDGSKRSRHSNAFFTGFGRFRKIVLFDTLIQQLDESELEAVLAHEIGHYRRRHILKFLILSALLSFAGFYILFLLAQKPWFYEAFGFRSGSAVPALLLFGLLSGLVTFWLSPLLNYWSRRYEYQADAFAASAINRALPLITALRKLNEKNLSNLTPHPVYSGFYYSHPTLLEREAALKAAAPGREPGQLTPGPG